MSDFESEIAAQLRRRAEALRVDDQVRDRLVGRVRTHQRRRRVALVGGPVVLVAVAAIVASVIVPSAGHPSRQRASAAPAIHGPRSPTRSAPTTSPAPTTSTATTGSSPVPAGFVIESFTAVSPSRWWLLGTVPCGGKLCPEIAATADAGANFTTMPGPGGAYPASQGTPPVSSIRFADPNDGWVFGPELYATHDGGKRWTAVDLPGRVAALEPGLDRVFATVDPPTPPCYSRSTCNASTPGPQLWRSTPGSNRWAVDAAAGYVSAGLAVHGTSVWVMNSIATKDGPALGTRLRYSADGGDHFVTQPQPVTGVACDYQPVSNQVLWAYCSGGHFMFVYRSTDAGAHFTETQDTQTPNANNCPNGSRLAAATETTAVAACNLGGKPLLLTTNGGATWTVAQPALNRSGYWEPIGFTTADVGYMLWRTGYGPTSVVQLWQTSDGGLSWQQVKADS